MKFDIEGEPEEIARFLANLKGKLADNDEEQPEKPARIGIKRSRGRPKGTKKVVQNEEPKPKKEKQTGQKVYVTKRGLIKRKGKKSKANVTTIMKSPRYLEAARLVRQEGMCLTNAVHKVFGYYDSKLLNNVRKVLAKQGFTPDSQKKKDTPATTTMTKVIVVQPKPKPEQKRAGDYSKQRARMKFIHSRIRTLVRENAMDFGKAQRIAIQEWNQHGKVVKVDLDQASKKSLLPPRILPGVETNKLLIDVLQNIIANNGRMTYANEGSMLGCSDYSSWQWMMQTIMSRSGEISKYFNVVNKFKYEKYGNTTSIVYG